ncbi:MAG: PASTA domain-containing protein, partial [Oscillospiraceae bacterium]|nr:PASTA domain-containing protein [Oscillospiraceae bacterium]
STVVLFAGGAKETAEVIVPNVTGLTISQARAKLESYGLYMSTKGVSENSSTVKAYRQSVPAETAVESGSVIEVTFVESDTSIMEHR